MALSGTEYLESIRDGREVWLDGEKVDDVTTHPGFANSARFLASLYDTLHEDQHRKTLTWTTPRGAVSHKAFMVSRTRRHLAERVAAMEVWARKHYGFMGRTPDYKGGLAVSIGSWPEFFAPYQDNCVRWYEKLADSVLFMNHIGVNPMVDRSKQPHELPDINVRAVRETDSGIVVRGAKMVGTAAVFTHCNLVFSFSPVPLTDDDRDQALVFIVPTGAPGLKLVSRRSYELAAKSRSPFDHPLSSRFDENDATLIFDDVHVPWENVLIYRDADKANRFFPVARVTQNLMLHGCVRLGVKLEFLIGLMIKMAQQNGTVGFRGIRVRIGEMIGYLHMVKAMVREACAHPDPGPGGSVVPAHRTIFALRALGPMIYPRIRDTIQRLGAGGFVQLPSSVDDLLSAELRPFLDHYYRGTGVDAHNRIKLWKLAWDAIGTEFGARQELFERNYAGNEDNVRLENLFLSEQNGDVAGMTGFVDQCLSDYDLEGWTDRTAWSTDP